jgi:hypothetical protein
VPLLEVSDLKGKAKFQNRWVSRWDTWWRVTWQRSGQSSNNTTWVFQTAHKQRSLARNMPSEAPLVPAGVDADAANKPEVAAGVAEVAAVPENSTPRFAAVQRGRTRTVHFVRHAQATHNEAALTQGRQAYSDQVLETFTLLDMSWNVLTHSCLA